MALIRWDAFREMDLLRRQMDRLFYDLAAHNREVSDIPQTDQADWMPAIELQDNGAELILKAEVPGIEPKDLDIQVTRDAVLLVGEHRYEKRTEEQGHFRSEFRYGSFKRVIPLPAKVQNDSVKADLKDGILILTLPKVAEEQNRIFKVNLVGGQANQGSLEAGDGHTERPETEPQTSAISS